MAAAAEPQWWTNQKRACGLPANLAYETWRQQGFPCRSAAPPVDYQEQQRQQQLELERQKELDRLKEIAERKQKADAADQKGLEAANRGDWKEAANWFIEALGFAPNSTEIRAHLDRANTALADGGSAAEIGALRTRIADSIATARLEAVQREVEDRKAAQRLKALSEELRIGSHRHYRPSGNAFIGGTSWIVGYNVQSENPAVIAKEKEMLKKQMELAGIPYAAGIDFGRYNFVLGIGASTNILVDLKNRVVFDEFRNGQFSAREQGLYNSLRDRQFGELACHSNGAMVCLAALENQDVRADRVVLYGPQITRESLNMWDQLLQSGQVKSVQIYVNQNDPVPPFSLALGDLFQDVTAEMALLNSSVLKSTINETSPRIVVRTFACGNGYPAIKCHDMVVYKRDRGCLSRPSGKTVPGTSLPGKGGVPEPPPPC
ncbi:MAG: hypothetical protein ACXV9O_16070 [Candidatus Angelobacter sp.]